MRAFTITLAASASGLLIYLREYSLALRGTADDPLRQVGLVVGFVVGTVALVVALVSLGASLWRSARRRARQRRAFTLARERTGGVAPRAVAAALVELELGDGVALPETVQRFVESVGAGAPSPEERELAYAAREELIRLRERIDASIEGSFRPWSGELRSDVLIDGERRWASPLLLECTNLIEALSEIAES